MNILTELNSHLAAVKIPVEAGIFSGKAPKEYIVITPMADVFELHADNRPQLETQEARLSLYSKGNYIKRKNEIVRLLIAADFTVTNRWYIGNEEDTGYFHYVLDLQKVYGLEE